MKLNSLKLGLHGFRAVFREAAPPILLFLGVDLGSTLLFFGVSSPAVHIGTLRPLSTIPLKLLELAGAGLAVGLVVSLAARRIESALITMAVAFTGLLDVDHLPSVFGVAQPIRPAHSITFLVITLIGLSLVARGRYDIQAILVASFFAHMASDTGVFAIYAPFSFNYMSMQEYRIPLAIGSLMFALLAGYLAHRRRSGISEEVEVKGVMNRI